MFYVIEQIPRKVLLLESIPMDTELILLEFTVKIQRWLCVGIYRPLPQNEKYFIDHLSKTLGQLSCQYDKNMLIGDFNWMINKKSLEKFLQKIRQSSIVFKKPGFLSKKLKTFTGSNCHRSQYFWLKLHIRYLLTNVYKRVCENFFYLFV